MANGQEEIKFHELEIEMRRLKNSNNGSERLLNGFGVVAATHAWLETIVPGDMFRNFVLYGWATRFVDEVWLDHE